MHFLKEAASMNLGTHIPRLRAKTVLLVLALAFACCSGPDDTVGQKAVYEEILPEQQVLTPATANGQQAKTDSVVALGNGKAGLLVHLHGGALVRFWSSAIGENPFSWEQPRHEMPENNQAGAPLRGHFAAIGRFGAPSEGEAAMGLKHDGAPANTWWDVIEASPLHLIMEHQSSAEGLETKRTLTLADTVAMFVVQEEVKNTTATGRPFVMAQQLVLAPPFLGKGTLFDTNAGKGFMQAYRSPDPERYAYEFPTGTLPSGRRVNLRSGNENLSFTSSHVFASLGDYAWLTVANPAQGLMLGYVWRAKDYPWLHLGNQYEDGRVSMKKIVFASAGTSQPFSQMLFVKNSFQGIPFFEYLDAGQAVSKAYACFLVKIPENFTGTSRIDILDNELSIELKTGQSKTSLTLPLGQWF